MSVWTRVVRWLSGRAREGPPVWRALDARGASRALSRFAEDHGRDVVGLWVRCPRPTWAIEIAARAGVDGALVEHAVRDLVASVKDDDRPSGDAAHALVAAPAAARAYAAGELGVDELVERVAQLSSTLVESRGDVRAALGAVPAVGPMNDIVLAKDAYDRVYVNAQRELTEIVRRRISAREVQVALEGLTAHPYR